MTAKRRDQSRGFRVLMPDPILAQHAYAVGEMMSEDRRVSHGVRKAAGTHCPKAVRG